MDEDDVLRIFKEKQALWEGHFELASGEHSPIYLQCAKVLQYPRLAHRLCSALAVRFQGKGIDLVAGPAIGGVIVAYEMARILGVRAIYAERKEKNLELRRGFEIRKEERVLLVEDVVTTGGSIVELAGLVEQWGAQIAGGAAWIDRTGGKFKLPFVLESLARVEFPTYERGQCPMCRKGLELTKPGSQKIKRIA